MIKTEYSSDLTFQLITKLSNNRFIYKPTEYTSGGQEDWQGPLALNTTTSILFSLKCKKFKAGITERAVALKLSPLGCQRSSRWFRIEKVENRERPKAFKCPLSNVIDILKCYGLLSSRQRLNQAEPEQRGYQNHMQEGCCQRPLLMQIWCSSRKYFSNKYLENIIKEMQLIIGL